MRKHFLLISLGFSCPAFILSGLIYSQTESTLMSSCNLALMLISGYLIVRALDVLMGFSK